MSFGTQPEARRPPESEEEPADIELPLISDSISSSTGEDDDLMTRSQAWNLYTSHFLSTWNVRTYEFAAIIFTAAAYPDTLVATSIRGIVRALASILFSSSVGRWVDHSPDRLKTLLCTISINRTAVISASALWYFIVEPKNDSHARALAASEGSAALLRGAIFTLILALGILEGLSASANMLSMERDWVVTAASPVGQPYDLTHLNSSMRRIDLICKLIAPILISVIVSATNIKIGVLVVGFMSAGSWAVEFWCARRVWLRNPRLRALKAVDVSASASAAAPEPGARNLLSRTAHGLRRYADDFRKYFTSTVWIPSLSLAFLHISALTYSATFITYLLAVGFSLDLITVARAAGSVVEISSTVVTPVGVSYLGKAKNHGRTHHDRAREHEEEASTALLEESPEEELQATTETGLERLGLWGLSFQLINLIPVVFALWSLSPPPTPHLLLSRLLTPLTTSRPLLAFTLFFFLSISRLGLWVFDLTTQQLTQTMTPPSHRSSFTGVEYSLVSVFELTLHVITMVLHRPDQFRWIAMASLGAVALSTVAYAAWVAKMRGHLVHWERIGIGKGGMC